MADLIITPSTGKLEFVDNSTQTIRRHSFTLDAANGIVLDAPFSASSITAPLNIINVTAGSSNVNYPFIFASSGETGAKSLLMDSAGGTYNPSTNTATIDVSGNSATTTLASNSTQLNGQAASYYTDVNARLGYTPVNKAGDTVTGNLIINGNFTVNGATTLFSASNVYISSSQLYIEDNILTLNAFSPYLRYAGVEMYDSGSGTLSSLLWDGEADYFFLTGSSVNGKIITGPDGQTNLTANYIPKATAGYKLGNSLIYDNGTNVGIGTTSPVSKLHIEQIQNAESLITLKNDRQDLGDVPIFGISAQNGVTAVSKISFYRGGGGSSGYLTFSTKVDNASSLTEKVRIDGAGNVGIGSTSPANRFEVAGSTFNRASFIATANVQTGIQIQRTGGVSNTNWEIYSPASSGDLRINNVADYVTFKSGSGWVGIGTTSPADKLQVGAGHISIDAGYKYYMDANVGAVAIRKDGTSMVFTVGATDKVYINESGNVGIGTSSPSGKLEVRTDAASTYIFSGSSTSGYATTFTMDDTASYFGHDSSVRSLILRTNSTARLTVKGDGNVGIGTTSPGYKLDVNGNSAFRDTVNFGPSVGLISWGSMGGGTGFGIRGESGRGFSLGANGSWDYLVINTSGNVGIGTTSPGTKLDVVGAVTMPVIKQSATLYAGTDIIDDSSTRTVYFNIPDGGYSPIRYFKVARIKITGNYQNVSLNGYFTAANSALHVGFERKVEFDFIAYAATNAGSPTVTYLKRGPDTTTVLVYAVANGGGAGTTYYDVYIKHGWYNDTHGELAIRVGYGSAVTVWQAGLDSGTSAPVDTLVNANSNYAFDTTGFVGIGTSSPSYKLDIAGGIKIGGEETLPFAIGSMYLSYNSAINRIYYGDGTGYDLRFSKRGAGATTDFVTFKDNGNVGIGTTSPGTLLQVHGSNPFFRINNTITGDHGIKISYNNSDTHGLHLLYNANSALSYIDNTYPTSSGQVYGDIYFRQNVAGTMTTRMTIKADGGGNVGIGTTAPGYKLDVNGPIGVGGFRFIDQSTYYFRIFEPAGNIALYLGNASDPTNYYDNTSHAFRNRGGSSNYVTINSSGNVGIGTTSPGAPLTIYKASNPGMRINGGGNYSYIQMDDGASSGYLFKNTSSDTSNGALAGAMYTYTDSSKAFQHIHAGTPLFTILSGGSVGIGTTSPTVKLTVSADVTDADVGQLRLVGSTSSAKMLSLGYQTTSNYGFISALIAGTGYSNLALQPNGGNVGIGTTSPTSKLDIRNGNLELSDSSFFNVPEIRFTAESSGRYVFAGIKADEDSAYNGHLEFWTTPASNNNTAANAAFAERMRITSTGNVGIGSTSPGYKLDVVGDINFSSTLKLGGVDVISNSSSDVYINGRVIRNASTSTQDGMYIGYNSGGTTNAHIRFYANAGNERMRIQANDGNVGIGTTSAGKKLDVEGIVRTRGATGTGGFEIGAATTGAAKWRIEWDSVSDSLDFNWVG